MRTWLGSACESLPGLAKEEGGFNPLPPRPCPCVTRLRPPGAAGPGAAAAAAAADDDDRRDPPESLARATPLPAFAALRTGASISPALWLRDNLVVVVFWFFYTPRTIYTGEGFFP